MPVNWEQVKKESADNPKVHELIELEVFPQRNMAQWKRSSGKSEMPVCAGRNSHA